MTEIIQPDVLPAASTPVPPPVPPKKEGFLRRLFFRRRQAVAMETGYLEVVDLARAIRAHLERQEAVQNHLLGLLAKVPETLDRQNEVMGLFKDQLQSTLAHDQTLSEGLAGLTRTLTSIDETQKASSKTVTDMIQRSHESEQLLREVMRRSERRMTLVLVLFLAACRW